MKIVTYNVNSINARLPNLLRWLAESTPDVVCLQELKAPQDKFPETAIREAGYGVIWHGQKSWNGVAILARNSEPQEIRRVLPGDPDDVHSRYIEANVAGVVIGCRHRALNLNTSCAGSVDSMPMLPNCFSPEHRSSLRATTT
jgi:exodeoxyribonuclease-3